MGEQRGLRFSRILMLLAYASLMLCTLTGALPLYALLALLTAIPIYLVYGRLEAHNPSVVNLPLMGASMRATIRCGAGSERGIDSARRGDFHTILNEGEV